MVDSLEKRWNEKPEQVNQLKNEFLSFQSNHKDLSIEDENRIVALGNDFSTTWNSAECPIKLKKRIIRNLIEEIIVDVNEENQTLSFIIHWHGGNHSTLTIPRPLSANKAHKTSADDTDIIKKMAVRYRDEEIAKVLSRLGRKTGKGNRWSKSSVQIKRTRLGIKLAKKDRQDGILNAAEAKRYCGISDSTLMRLIKSNVLPANQIVRYAPFEIKKSDLDKEPVLTILKTLKKTGKLELGGGYSKNQEDLFH